MSEILYFLINGLFKWNNAIGVKQQEVFKY